MRISADTTAAELATVVSSALESAGIVATLSGGGAVSIYTDNRYQSEDLDFVTTALLEELRPVLEALGFAHTGSPRLSVFEHPEARWYLEFPPAPLSFGTTLVDASLATTLETPAGVLRIISPTQCVMDRLIAAASWQDPQSLHQAILVAESQAANIDWGEIRSWVDQQDISASPEVRDFFRRAGGLVS